MLAVIHHINSPKLKPYPSGVIEMAKNKIRQQEASMLNIVAGSLTQDKKLQVIDALYSIYNSDTFLQKYNEMICEGINKAFQTEFKNLSQAEEALFGMKDQGLGMTYAFKDVTSNSRPETALKKYDNLIANLRNAFSYLFPDSSFSDSNKDFFNELSTAFKKDAVKQGAEKTSLTELLANLDVLGKQYEALVGEHPKKGQIPKDWISKTYGSLYKVIGTALWERITMEARQKALSSLDIEKELSKIFTAYGWDIKTVNIGKAIQSGAERGQGGKSILADSMVEITILDSDGSIVAKVTTGDSTKFSQSLATRGIRSESTGTKITNISELMLNTVLEEISHSLKEYWEKRMSPFLTANNTKLNDIVDNWNDTLQAVKIMAAFDAIAARIGGGVQTLSFNTKIMSVRTIAQLAATTNPSGSNYISLSGLSNITNTAKGGKYSSYISDQYYNRPKGDNPDEPERHQERYNTFIKGIMDTKFKASVNVLAASRNL